MVISFSALPKFQKKVTVVLVDELQVQADKFSFKHAALSKALKSLVQAGAFAGKSGDLFPLLIDQRLILCVGVGPSKKPEELTSLRISLRRALLSVHLRPHKDIEIIPHQQKAPIIQSIIEAIEIGTYTWDKYKKASSKKMVAFDQKRYTIVADKKVASRDAVRVCAGVRLTRDLINDNADVVTAPYVEKIVRGLIKGKRHIRLEVLNQKEMLAKGLGFHLAVNQGSAQEPKLLIVNYQGGLKKAPYTALIGKGMTFDTGGLNLKLSGHIETMRIDMSGAAAVVGTLKNAIELNLKKNVLFVCGLAENAIGSKAYKPGDVIRGYAGKTAEVANTDAEGRLVLADAIAYVVKNYKPARLIDIATLTGACVVALGLNYTGLMANDDDLAQSLLTSAQQTDDRAWQLPIFPELKQTLRSPIADMRNLGSPRGAAGTLTAAEFLRQFTDGTPWAHLDIAGTAFVEASQRFYFGHGATGAGVRLLTDFLLRLKG